MPDWDEPQILAEGVKPDAAIEYWQDRAKLTWDQAKGLADGAKARAFYVTGLYQQDMVNLVSDALKEALENGETLEDFKARISEVIKSQQWHERKIENIFRTNMQTAYMAGRYKKMQEVKAFRPYWQYVAVMDKRVRPNHAVLHGLVYPADHEFWDSNFPPNGFRCRCTVITLSERQVKKKGLTVQSDMPGPTMWTDPKTGMEYHVNFPGADRGFSNNPFKDWAKTGGVSDLPALNGFPPKKAPVTQKSLQAKIADLDSQIQSATDATQKAELQARKEACQKLLEQKAAKALKEKLTKQCKKLQEALDTFQVKTYSGIWPYDVTTADWAQKASSIQAKKDYFLSKLANGGLTAEEVAKFQGYLKDLDEFSEKGQEYASLQKSLQEKKDSLATLKKGAKKQGIDESACSKERQDKALWAQTVEEADKHVRPECGKVWRKASTDEKEAIYDYTSSSGRFNRPLSGYEKPWNTNPSHSGFEPQYFKGINKVWINFEGVGDKIRRMTELIERSSYDFDMWLQRFTTPAGLEALLGMKRDSLMKMAQHELEALIGKKFTNHAFTSCGVSKGAGLPGTDRTLVWRVFAPKGTQMMYCEPFSKYGLGAKLAWDGIKGQASFGHEAEMLIQRGATFRIIQIEKKGGAIYVDMEVLIKKGYQKIQQDPGEWKGDRKQYK